MKAGSVDLQAKVKVRIAEYAQDAGGRASPRSSRVVNTTVGRALLSEILPKGLSFDLSTRT